MRPGEDAEIPTVRAPPSCSRMSRFICSADVTRELAYVFRRNHLVIDQDGRNAIDHIADPFGGSHDAFRCAAFAPVSISQIAIRVLKPNVRV